MINRLFILLIGIAFVGCGSDANFNDSEKRNNNWAWVVEDGSSNGVWVPIGTENNLVSGIYTLFFSNGNVYEKGTISNGKNVDTVFTHDINGILIKYKIMLGDSSYDRIVNEGEYTSHHWKTGKVLDNGTSHNHVLGGNWTKYYESGKLEFKDSIVGSKKTRTKYHELGGVEAVIHYVGGKREGHSKFWHKNGELYELSNWKTGSKNGAVEYYFDNGLPNQKSNWIDGKKEGQDSLWFENGKLNQVATYVDGNPNGYLEIWFPNGNYKFKGNMVNGLKQGEIYRYFENGNIQNIAMFKNDKANGLVKIYNEKGELIEESVYKNGEHVKTIE